MSQIATFFVPTALPNAAGAVAREAGASAGGENFADILVQFQTALQQGGAQARANAGQIAPLQNPQLIAQLSAALTQAGSNLSADDLAAQLQAIAGNGKGAPLPPQFQGLLDLLAAGVAGQDGSEAAGEPDATLAAQLAALQTLLQTSPSQAAPTAQNSAAAAAVAAEIGLRGTIAPEAKAATKQDIATNAEAATDDAAIPPALLVAASRTQAKSGAKPNAGEDRGPAAAKADAPAAGPSDQFPDPLKTSSHHPSNTSPTIQSAASHASTGAAATAQQSATSASSALTPQAIVAAPAPVPSTLTAAQQISVTVANAPQTGVPLEALAVHIARKFDGGASQFEIRLHPAELGQLDISLSVADDGRIQAVLRAERAETLDILQRDARTLEQQLRQAGLDVGSNALSFSLSGGNGQQRHKPFSGWPGFADAQDPAANMQQAASTYLAVRTHDGIDIRV